MGWEERAMIHLDWASRMARVMSSSRASTKSSQAFSNFLWSSVSILSLCFQAQA